MKFFNESKTKIERMALMKIGIVTFSCLLGINVEASPKDVSLSCRSDQLFQSRYLNADRESFSDVVPSEDIIQMTLQRSPNSLTMQSQSSSKKAKTFDDGSDFYNVEVWEDSSSQKMMIYASQINHSVLLHKRPDGTFAGVEKSISFHDHDNGVIIKEFTRPLLCEEITVKRLRDYICYLDPFEISADNMIIANTQEKTVNLYKVDSDRLTFLSDPLEVAVVDEKSLVGRYLMLLSDGRVLSINGEMIGVLSSSDQNEFARYQCQDKLM